MYYNVSNNLVLKFGPKAVMTSEEGLSALVRSITL